MPPPIIPRPIMPPPIIPRPIMPPVIPPPIIPAPCTPPPVFMRWPIIRAIMAPPIPPPIMPPPIMPPAGIFWSGIVFLLPGNKTGDVDFFPKARLQERERIDQGVGQNRHRRELFVDLRKVVEHFQVLIGRHGLPLGPRVVRLERFPLNVETLVIGVGNRGVLERLAIVGQHLGVVEHAREGNPTISLGDLLARRFGVHRVCVGLCLVGLVGADQLARKLLSQALSFFPGFALKIGPALRRFLLSLAHHAAAHTAAPHCRDSAAAAAVCEAADPLICLYRYRRCALLFSSSS